MPIKANIPGVGLVDFPDDVTDDELSSAAELLTKGRLQSAAATVAREPGRMAGGAVSGLARLGQLFGETMERQPMTFGPGGAIPSIATQTDEQLSKTLSRTPKTDAQMADELASDPLYQAGKNITAGAEEAFPTNPLHADRFETAVASGVGSVLGLLPSAIAGPAAPLVAGATYGLSQGEDMAQEAAATTDALIAKAKELGDTATAAELERDKFQKQTAAFLAGASVGAATEGAVGLAGRLVPIVTGTSRMGARIAEKVGERPVVKGLIEGTVREGTQETTEQIAQNIAAGQIYDPERRALEGVGMAGGAGAVVGGLFGGGAGAMARRRSQLRPTPAEAKVAPASADALDQLIDELARAPVATTPTEEDAITPPLEVPTTQEQQTAAALEAANATPAGTAETPPTPESTETIAAQLAATFDPASTKSVTLVTPGEEAPPVPASADVTKTPHGVAISNPEKITPEAVAEAGSGPVFDPGPLGMGAPVAESDTAVTTRTPAGTEVVSELATPETIPAAVQAQQAAVPGGVTSVVPAAEVISGRQPQAPATEEPKAPAAAPDSGQATATAAGEPYMLSEGDVVVSTTGRELTPFPRVDATTDRKTNAAIKRVDAWLRQNAIDEAKARGDMFNLRQFEAENPASMPPATKDGMSLYLFGHEQGSTRPPIRNDKGKKATSVPSSESQTPQAPAATPQPAGYGDSNKVFTKARKDAALAKLREKLKQVGAGIDPEILALGIEIGGYHAEAGIRAFADWSKSMVQDAGEAIRPYLRSIYNAIRTWPDIDTTGMDDDATVQALLHPKQQQEEQEAAIVARARAIATGEGTPQEKYAKLVALYEAQPRLGMRTGESKVNQAYSTPAPLAFIAGQLAQLESGKRILEPTAGNGMLLIGAPDSAEILANELDPKRLERLKRLFKKGFAEAQDASTRLFHQLASKFNPDRVVANPPFGTRLGEQGNERFQIQNSAVGNSTTSSIDLAIALNSLDSMTPDGKAVVILGAKTGSMAANINQEGRKKGYERREYLDLFKRFNVTDFFTLEGDLYDKMGAGWPVDVVVIDGKRPTPPSKEGGFPRPWVQAPRVYKDWAQLGEVLNEKPARTDIGSGPSDRGPGGGTGAGESGPSRTSDRRGGEPQPGRTQTPVATVGEARPDTGVPESRPEAGPAVVPAEDKGQGLAGASREPAPVNESLTEPYVSRSANKPAGLVVPSNIAADQRAALETLEREEGMSVDDYLAQKLGMSRDELYRSFSGPQIDATALAIRNIERGSALINSDQTGTGKGRTVAALIRYAMKRGLTPVFITAKKALYSDMAGRDLPDIGVKDFEPVVTDKTIQWIGPDGKERKQRLSTQEANEVFAEIAKTGKLPSGKQAFFTTIDQLQADKPIGMGKEDPKDVAKRKKDRKPRTLGPIMAAIKGLAPNAIIIMDEAHLAAGDTANINHQLVEDTGGGSIIGNAKGVYYASATFAKRPDNLALYSAGTSIKLSKLSPKQLIELFKRGRIPLQQALTSMLSRMGEFVRRQQNWDGVPMQFKKSTANAEQEIFAADTYTGFLGNLEAFSRQMGNLAEKMADSENQVAAEEEKVDLEAVNFSSRIFNLSSQYLTALRANAVANEAIEALRAGKKPVISFYNTMEGPISDLVQKGKSINFNGLLERELDNLLKITKKDPSKPKGEQKQVIQLRPQDLPPNLATAYYQIVDQIRNTDLGDMPVSPMDYVMDRIRDAGFTVGELTARGTKLAKDPDGKVVLVNRPRPDTTEEIAEFNRGGIDALVINGSASTGVSMHTSPKAIQKVRKMIIAQPNPDVNQFIQVLGRVMRFGQTMLPEYTIIQSALAAEQRFMVMLRKKMASLNANTSADSDSEMTKEQDFAQDIFNEVGDQVVGNVMLGNVDLANRYDIPLPIDDDDRASDDAPGSYASKVTGRFVMLPNDDAKRLWNLITELYADTIQALNDAGENPLKATVEDLRAKTIESSPFVAGDGKTPFDGPATMEKIKVKPTKAPPTHEEASTEAMQNAQAVRQRIREWMFKSREMEEARVKTARERGVEEDKIDKIRKGFRDARDVVASTADLIGTAYELGDSGYVGMPIDLKLRDKEMSDFTAPSSHYLVVRRNMVNSKAKFPLSQMGERLKLDAPLDDAEEKWNESIENADTRYIVTGNLLRGYKTAMNVSSGMAKPRVVLYTTEDGDRRTGILMPTSWEPGKEEGGPVAMVGTQEEFQNAVRQGLTMRDEGVLVRGTEIRVNAANKYRAIWSGWPFADAIQRGQDFVTHIAPGNEAQFFQYLSQKGVKLVADPIEAKLNDLIEKTRPSGKVFDFVAGVSYAVAHTALRIAKAIYVATRDITSAVNAALQHMHEEAPDGFDEPAARAKIEQAIQTGQDIIPPAAAPGTKTQMSKGLFIGPITQDTDRQWSEAAKEWVNQFGNDLQTAVEKATSPAVQMDAALRQYALTEILTRSNQQAERARNSVDTLKALRIQERAANALRDSGAQEFGKVGAARALAFKRIEGLMPVLAYRNLIRAAQDRLPFPEVTSENVRKWLQKAGRKAVSEVRASMKRADNVVARELKREVRDMGQTWREILTSSLDVQGDHRRALYARVFAHRELQGISPAGATEIVNLLADEWERQRMRIFRGEFRKEVPLPGVREKDVKKLEESLPAIVIQANLGMLDNETFRNAIAPKYGVDTFDGPTAEKVNKLAQAAQAAPAGVVRSRIIAQMMDAIRRSDTVQFKDIFRDYWFAAMLSGIRTQVDNGMSILNGVINTGMAMARNPGAAPLITSAYMRGFGEAAADFVPILKGERWRMHNVDIERPASALEALKQSQNPVARLFGNAAFVSRLIGALDHMNSLSTREAMKAWAMYRISPEDSKRALSVSKEDIDAARERAIQESTPKALLNKRVREILEERIPVEAVLSATDMGRQVSFQNEPYGLLGHFYRFIQNASNMEGKGNAKGAEADRFRQTTGAFLRIISGTAFARYALNYTNDILNYVAPVALYRWYQSSPANEGRSGLEFSPEFRELLITKSILGTLVATVAAAVFLGDDDDDERKRAIDITGSFRGLDAKKRNQLLSEGRQPYSIRIGDKYISYRQLPIAGVLGTVGEMRDRQLFDRAAFDQDSVAAKLANAGLAGALIVRDSSALVGLMDLLGFAQTYKYDTEGILAKSLPKFAARTLGSLIPNIAKELDAWTDPGLYRANAGWEYFMQQVPWVRREIPPGPAVDVFGDKIAVERKPWSRWVKERKQDPEWIVLGDLASKGVFMPIPGPWKIENDDGTRRDPTPAEMQSYQKKVGAEYRTFIREQGADLLAMDPDEARQQINRETSAIRKSVRAELRE